MEKGTIPPAARTSIICPPPPMATGSIPPPPGWISRTVAISRSVPCRSNPRARVAVDPDATAAIARKGGKEASPGAAYLATALAFTPLLAHRTFEFISVSLPEGLWQEASIHSLPPLAMLGVSILLWRRVAPLPGQRQARPNAQRLAIAAGMLLGGIAALANLLSMLARAGGGATGTVDPAAAALILHVAVLAPLAEEAAFRGLIYRQLRQSLAVLPATLVSALIFSMMHASFGQASWALVLGGVTALAYEQTRSLLAPVLVHALFNAVPIGMAMARSRPDDLGPIWLVLAAVSLVFVWAARGAARAEA